MDDSVARRYVDAWNSLDPETVAGVYAEDCIQEDLAMGTVCRGHDALMAFVREVKGASSDTRMVITTEQVSGDLYAVGDCGHEHRGLGRDARDEQALPLPGGFP